LHQQTRIVTINLCARQETELNLQLSYIVGGCSWNSSYDCRISYGEGIEKCVLTYFGSITNSSGEDWVKAKASLSTANPSLGGNPPILYPLQVTYSAPTNAYPYKNKKKVVKRQLSLVRVNEEEKEERKRDQSISDESGSIDNVVTESVNSQGTSISYTIKQLITIESDNKPHKVTIADVPLTVIFDYIIVPALTEKAYFRSQSTNDSEFELLPGNINVFINNVFVTQSNLANVNPTEKFTMYLGVDDSIKVRVKPVSNMDSKQGNLFGKKNVQSVKKEIVITNTKSQQVPVCVFQQIPFSQEESIKVKQIAPDPNDKETSHKDEFSIIQWKYDIPSGETQTVTLEYTIESAPDKTIGFDTQNTFEKTSY